MLLFSGVCWHMTGLCEDAKRLVGLPAVLPHGKHESSASCVAPTSVGWELYTPCVASAEGDNGSYTRRFH